MNPIIIYRVIAGIGTLIGAGGAAYGYDQHQKRKREIEIFDKEIDDLTHEVDILKTEANEKDALLFKSNEQVRILAREVGNLKKEILELEKQGDFN